MGGLHVFVASILIRAGVFIARSGLFLSSRPYKSTELVRAAGQGNCPQTGASSICGRHHGWHSPTVHSLACSTTEYTVSADEEYAQNVSQGGGGGGGGSSKSYFLEVLICHASKTCTTTLLCKAHLHASQLSYSSDRTLRANRDDDAAKQRECETPGPPERRLPCLTLHAAEICCVRRYTNADTVYRIKTIPCVR